MKENYRNFIYSLILTGIAVFIIISCKKNDDSSTIHPLPGTPVTDIDCNVHQTVILGTQTWMVDNLNVTHFNDSTEIPNVPEAAEWSVLTTPARCWYNNDSTTYHATYGVLYDWYAVNTGKLCPTGWHGPGSDEWTTLTTYLGGENSAGTALKESGSTHWNSQNTGNNSSGFTALPGGERSSIGIFFKVGSNGYWWSSTPSNSTAILGAKYRFMFSDAGSVAGDEGYQNDAFSVRCVKDN
jgi:uncharacterized protein (TIGR02145 family)